MRLFYIDSVTIRMLPIWGIHSVLELLLSSKWLFNKVVKNLSR